MGFNSVYRVLQNVFPQVDTRLLRAAAIENSKDADTAVDPVLTEIIPYLSKVAVEDASPVEDTLQIHSKDTKTLNGSTYSEAGSDHDEVCRDDGNEESASSGKHEKSNVKDGSDVISLVTPITTLYSNGADDHWNHVDTKTQESSTVKIGSDQGSHVSSTSSNYGYGCTNGTTSGNQLADSEDFDGMCPCGCNIVVPGESHQEQAHFDCSHLEVKNAVVQLAPLLIQDCKPDVTERGLQVAVVDPLLGDSEKPKSSGASDDAWKNDEPSRVVDFEDKSALNTVLTRSGQICIIDLLEDIIEDATSNKKTLFSAMVSVISLMRKVAELSKEKAARGGFDILVRVEDLKQKLQHAKEASNMHAGEVF